MRIKISKYMRRCAACERWKNVAITIAESAASTRSEEEQSAVNSQNLHALTRRYRNIHTTNTLIYAPLRAELMPAVWCVFATQTRIKMENPGCCELKISAAHCALPVCAKFKLR